MTQAHRPLVSSLRPIAAALALLAAACDTAADSQSLREQVAAGLADATIPLAEAIATAQTEGAGVAIDAELEVEHGAPTYRIEVIGDAGEVRIDIDPQSGAVLRNEASSSGNTEDNAANAAFAAGADWAGLIAAAEAHVEGDAFEIEADDGVFEVKVLVDAVVYEIDLSAAGEVVKSEVSDDWDDEVEHEDTEDGEDHGASHDDDGTGGDDNHGSAGSDDDGTGGDDDHGGGGSDDGTGG
ncbi:MAG: PepSY domain-containing protein [Myxococcales bacterium]|nr:PepSY domain-containing protein [Myxococcales bacterium]